MNNITQQISELQDKLQLLESFQSRHYKLLFQFPQIELKFSPIYSGLNFVEKNCLLVGESFINPNANHLSYYLSLSNQNEIMDSFLILFSDTEDKYLVHSIQIRIIPYFCFNEEFIISKNEIDYYWNNDCDANPWYEDDLKKINRSQIESDLRKENYSANLINKIILCLAKNTDKMSDGPLKDSFLCDSEEEFGEKIWRL